MPKNQPFKPLTTRPRHDPPPAVQQEVTKTLELLRLFLLRQEHTQLEVQRQLGWGRTSLSQLFTQHKRMRYDQLLQILRVIGVSPLDFFCELFAEQRRPLSTKSKAKIDRLFEGIEDLDGLTQFVTLLLEVLRERGHLSETDLANLCAPVSGEAG